MGPIEQPYELRLFVQLRRRDDPCRDVENTGGPGPDPEHRDYGSFADFSDPDGNTWVLQERRGEPVREPGGPPNQPDAGLR